MTVENRLLNVHNVNVHTSGSGVGLHDVTRRLWNIEYANNKDVDATPLSNVFS